MAEPSDVPSDVPSEPSDVPSEPSLPRTCFERLEGWLEQKFVNIGQYLYRTPRLLSAQILVSFVAAVFCGFQTRNQTHDFKAAATTTTAIGVVYLFALRGVFLVRNEIKIWGRAHIAKHRILYSGLGAFGIVSLLKLCIFVSDLLGSQKEMDGFVTSFFLFSHLHIVSFTKLLGIKDAIYLSDSVMAVALLICTRLDSKETVLRSIVSYAAAFSLICFKNSVVPFEREPKATQPPIVDLESQNSPHSFDASREDDLNAKTLREKGDASTQHTRHETLPSPNSQPRTGGITEHESQNSPHSFDASREDDLNAKTLREKGEASTQPTGHETLPSPNIQPRTGGITGHDGLKEEDHQLDPSLVKSQATQPPIVNRDASKEDDMNAKGLTEKAAKASTHRTDYRKLPSPKYLPTTRDTSITKLLAAKKDRQLDLALAQSALASITVTRDADLNAKRLREKELASVKINPADVEFIVNELELDKKVVEKALREHKGDVVAATRDLLS